MKNEFTIMLPVANNLGLINDCLSHLISVTNIPIILVVDNNKNDDQYVKSEQITVFHLNPPSRYGLSKIWNECIKNCPTDNVIMASWRCRPTTEHFKLLQDKLNEGHGLVAIQTLHFFAFHKYLMQKIGFFDEGLIKGQYEDTDYFNRLYANDISMYVSEEINEVSYKSMWLESPEVNRTYYEQKWTQTPPYLIQLHEEQNIQDRTLYNFNEIRYNTFDKSELKVPGIYNYYNNSFPNIKKDF